VPDLEAGRDRLTELLGIDWNPVREFNVHVRDGGGNDMFVAARVCLSKEEPGFELIQEVAGTPWVCNEHSNLHHLAFSSKAVAADSNRLGALDCPFELMNHHPDGTPFAAAYHRDLLGLRIEMKLSALGR
jgi:hypothetical protein